MFIKKLVTIALACLPLLLSPQPVFAHAFGATYTLPIPFWLYLYAGAAALLLSFVLVGFFFTKIDSEYSFPEQDISNFPLIRFFRQKTIVTTVKGLSFLLFLLTIVSGFIGVDISSFNFNMTFFWIIFVLGFTYLTFFIGNIWPIINPWQALITLYEKMTKQQLGIVPYPKQAFYVPAFILYMIFIALELMGGVTPFSLSIIVLQYTLLTLFAVFLFGKDAWFTYGEFFSVFFRFIGFASIIRREKKKIFIRLPFVGLLAERVTDMSCLLFILFMLASTAFDGFRETNAWYGLYWGSLARILTPLFGDSVSYTLAQFFVLVLSPFLFLALYSICIGSMKFLIKTEYSFRQLAYLFGFSLVPIAFVYHVAHYLTLLLLQGQAMIGLISDPFGWGTNFFGTAGFTPNAGMLQASFVWHLQVTVIVTGHIVSVYLSHIIALRVFKRHSLALISQIPMLILMIAYTVIGLWILSQPLGI